MTQTNTPTPGTQHQFGYEWDLYPEILPIHQEQFRRWIAPFDEAGFQGKTFVDGGCGMGRNAHWAMVAGASGGLAIDYDERTLAQARKNLAPYPTLEVRHQSFYDLDEPERFDIAFSIGVIHHLAEPRKAVENLVKALKPGGTLILWVYGLEGNERYLAIVDPMRKHLTSRMPHGALRLASRLLSFPLWAYVRLPHEKPYLKLLREMSLRSLELIVLDQLIPSIAAYWTREETEALVAGLPVENVRLAHTNGMSWTLVAEKRRDAAPDAAPAPDPAPTPDPAG